jgi:hypothetical protein
MSIVTFSSSTRRERTCIAALTNGDARGGRDEHLASHPSRSRHSRLRDGCARSQRAPAKSGLARRDSTWRCHPGRGREARPERLRFRQCSRKIRMRRCAPLDPSRRITSVAKDQWRCSSRPPRASRFGRAAMQVRSRRVELETSRCSCFADSVISIHGSGGSDVENQRRQGAHSAREATPQCAAGEGSFAAGCDVSTGGRSKKAG